MARSQTRDDRKEPGSEAVLGYPDAEGWGSLETSLKAIVLYLRCTTSACPKMTKRLVDILSHICRHTNRFVREQAQYCIANSVHFIRTAIDRDATMDQFHDWVASGLEDNWSQVRYAALTACRSLIRESAHRSDISNLKLHIIPLLLVNRHFVAEGVKRLAQETWRILVGPQGGKQLVGECLQQILEYLYRLSDSPNHSVREAVASCTLELCRRVLPCRAVSLSIDEVSTLVRVCIAALEDDTWPVRDVGAQATYALFQDVYPTLPLRLKNVIASKLGHFAASLIVDIFDPMLPLRDSSSRCYAYMVSLDIEIVGGDAHSWTTALDALERKLGAYTRQPPSAVKRENGTRITSDESHENRPMYSCGSLISNQSIRRLRSHTASDDCCSGGHGDTNPQSQPWEITDGAIRLYYRICEFLTYPPVLREIHLICLPIVIAAFEYDGYANFVNLRRCIIEELSLPYMRSCQDPEVQDLLRQLIGLIGNDCCGVDTILVGRCLAEYSSFIHE